jgi:hypothetical protein
MSTKQGFILIFTLSLLGLTACTTFYGVTPIYPKIGNPRSPEVADSIQPTFRWKPSPEPNVSYDLIIYEGGLIPGKEVYYRQGINAAEHKVEDPLRANTGYCWSVRVRRAEKVSDWSRYRYQIFIPMCFITVHDRIDNALFNFKTP